MLPRPLHLAGSARASDAPRPQGQVAAVVYLRFHAVFEAEQTSMIRWDGKTICSLEERPRKAEAGHG
eukprot:590868-Alexandrium_andersonii.AAC.1